MMIAVAIFALGLVFVIPVLKGLIWLYGEPRSCYLVRCSLDSWSDSLPWSDSLRKPVAVGQIIPVRFPYVCEMGPANPPAWLPYKVSVDVRVIDVPSGGNYKTGTVEETHTSTHFLMNGAGGWSTARGDLHFDLVPRHPGSYVIRYESRVTDAFGRNRIAECISAGFEVK
jgi:hypothetical protein